MPRLLPVTIVSIISLILISVATSCAPTMTATSVSGGDIDTFRSSLEKSDFTLKLAPFVHVDLVKLYEAGKLANAAGNNAGAPYKGVFGAIPENIEIKDINALSNAPEKIDSLLYGTP
ncbi:MAG: hypothetical protein MUO97_10280, partial [Dehalococcoidia bacterium]|nr:hypothetical protein [Dehalococcoidia bacterium]